MWNSSIKLLIDILVVKANSAFNDTLKASLWAGVFISLGGILYTLATGQGGNTTTSRFIGALLFTVGLNLVVFLKAQLFTGNNLMFYGIFTNKMYPKDVFRNWVVVYLGNFIGSLIAACICYIIILKFNLSNAQNLSIALVKTRYSILELFIRAIACNTLVCIAIWFAITAKTLLKKIIGIVIPITVFVFLGFEHSIANMFFIPLGLSFSEYSFIDTMILFFRNLIPVTFGNIIGGLIVSGCLLLISQKK